MKSIVSFCIGVLLAFGLYMPCMGEPAALPVPKMFGTSSEQEVESVRLLSQQLVDMLSNRSPLNERLSLLNYRRLLSFVVKKCHQSPTMATLRRDREREMRLALTNEKYLNMEKDLLALGMVSTNENIKGMSRLFLCKVLGSTAGQGSMSEDLNRIIKAGYPETFEGFGDSDWIVLECSAFVGDVQALDFLRGIFLCDRKCDDKTRRLASRALTEAGFPIAKSQPSVLKSSDSVLLRGAFSALCDDGMFGGYERYGLWQMKRLATKVVETKSLPLEDRLLISKLAVNFPRDINKNVVQGLSKQEVEELRTAILTLIKQGDDDVKEVATMGVFPCIIRDEDVELCRELMKNLRPRVRTKGAYVLVRRSKKIIEACSDILLTLLDDESLEVRREAYLVLKVGLKEPASNWESAETIASERPKLEQAYQKK